jgi:hypothetical protein
MSFETDGFVKLNWSNASKDVDWYSWRVYRRLLGDTTWTLLIETRVDQALYEYHDWIVGANYTYEYAVVQVATRFGSLVESAYVPQQATPQSSDYWLIDEFDEANNMRLYQVTDDSYDDEYETEELTLVNRGRHIDIGEHWGIKGSLTAQIRDQYNGPSARTQITQFRAFRERRDTAWLRTPFGDVWQVAVHNMSFDRLAGVGNREFGSLSIPYSEVSRDA